MVRPEYPFDGVTLALALAEVLHKSRALGLRSKLDHQVVTGAIGGVAGVVVTRQGAIELFVIRKCLNGNYR